MNRLLVVLLLIVSAASAVVAVVVEEVSLPLWAAAAVAGATAAVGLLIKKPVERLQEHTDPHRFTKHLVKGKAVRVRDAARDVPGHLGVHPARYRDPDDVYSDQLPDYVSRPELEGRVRDLLKAHGLVVVTGGSATGKSRMAYEVVRGLYPERMLYRPVPGEAGVRGLIAAGALPRKAVFWLDGLEDHLAQGLRAEDIAGLLPEGHGNAVVATMRVHPGGAGEERTGQDQEIFLRRFAGHEVQVPRGNDGYSEEVPDDPRIREAVGQSRHGLTEYLAQGPAAYQRWGRLSGNAATHRTGAVINAAVDARRAGRHTPLPKGLLRELHELYVDGAEGAGSGRQIFEEALAEAARPFDGASGCLMESDQDPGAYYAFDYLVDRAQEGEEPVAPRVLKALVEATEGPELVSLGLAAQENARECALRAADRRLTEQPDDAPALGLRGAVLLEMAHGPGMEDEWHDLRGECSDLEWGERTPEAVDCLRRAVEGGDERSRPVLGAFLQRSGRFEEALEHLQKVDEPGSLVLFRIGKALRGLGRDEEALEILYKAGGKGPRRIFLQVGAALVELGNRGIALELYADFAEASRTGKVARRLGALAMHATALLHLREGRISEAVEFAEQGADRKEAWAFDVLTEHFEEQGNNPMVSLWTQRAADAGLLWALIDTEALTDQEIEDSWEEWVWHVVDIGDLRSERALEISLYKAERARTEEDTGADAQPESGPRVEDRAARYWEQGRYRELILLLGAEVAAKREEHAAALDEALEAVDPAERSPLLRESAESAGHHPMALVLAIFHAGFESRAEEVLWFRAYRGDHPSVRVLAILYMDRGKHTGFMELLRYQVHLGSSFAAAELARYLFRNREAVSAAEPLIWPLASFARSEGQMTASIWMTVYVFDVDTKRLAAESVESGEAGHLKLAFALLDEDRVEEAEAVIARGEEDGSITYHPATYLNFAGRLAEKGLGARAEPVLDRLPEDGLSEEERSRLSGLRSLVRRKPSRPGLLRRIPWRR